MVYTNKHTHAPQLIPTHPEGAGDFDSRSTWMEAAITLVWYLTLIGYVLLWWWPIYERGLLCMCVCVCVQSHVSKQIAVTSIVHQKTDRQGMQVRKPLPGLRNVKLRTRRWGLKCTCEVATTHEYFNHFRNGNKYVNSREKGWGTNRTNPLLLLLLLLLLRPTSAKKACVVKRQLRLYPPIKISKLNINISEGGTLHSKSTFPI